MLVSTDQNHDIDIVAGALDIPKEYRNELVRNQTRNPARVPLGSSNIPVPLPAHEVVNVSANTYSGHASSREQTCTSTSHSTNDEEMHSSEATVSDAPRGRLPIHEVARKSSRGRAADSEGTVSDDNAAEDQRRTSSMPSGRCICNGVHTTARRGHIGTRGRGRGGRASRRGGGPGSRGANSGTLGGLQTCSGCGRESRQLPSPAVPSDGEEGRRTPLLGPADDYGVAHHPRRQQGRRGKKKLSPCPVTRWQRRRA